MYNSRKLLRFLSTQIHAAENLRRAELAEYREQAHQERWAMEVDRLWQEIRAMRGGR
jgi:hypothetical protein